MNGVFRFRRPRPLDQTLPQRLATAWIRLRAKWTPRIERAVLCADFFATQMRWWVIGLAATLGLLFVMAWLDARDASLARAAAEVHIAELSAENARLADLVAAQAASRDRPLFYLIEAGDPAVAQEKLQNLAMVIAGHAHHLSLP